MDPGEIDRLPSLPGVYLMRDAQGKLLYVGKANNLRQRVGNYFTKGGDARFTVRYLVGRVASIQTIITGNEKEAFLLENTLIKQEQPRYNLRLRDDKTYVSVRINLAHPWPRAVIMRRRNERNDGALYLGPYDSAASARETLRLLQRVFPIRSCPDHVLKNRTRPCLLHQIGRCCAPCVLPVDKADYDEMVQGTALALKGKTTEVAEMLHKKMWTASEALDFEKAAAIRDRINAIERTVERQLVHKHDGMDRDVIVMRAAGGKVAFAVFNYRNGLLTNSRPYILKDLEREPGELMREFIARFYEMEPPPREVLVDPEPEDSDLIEAWLAERREAKVEIARPQRGDRAQLVRNAVENCERLLEQAISGRKSLEEIHAEIMDRFGMEEPPEPMECYDISTLQGYLTVGSQVTFREGKPDKARYRHYKIKTVEGQDDFASMREVLTRRFKKAVDAGETLPGLVVIDGGKGQLGVAVEVFADLGIEGVALVGMAKSKIKRRGDATWKTEERFFLPGRKNPVVFHANSPALYLLQQLRDEAHRFGVTFHREWRKRSNLRSSLEDLPGMGKTRAASLLRRFGSMKGLTAAPLEEIARTPGMPAKVAAIVHQFLHAPETDPNAAANAENEPEVVEVDESAGGDTAAEEHSNAALDEAAEDAPGYSPDEADEFAEIAEIADDLMDEAEADWGDGAVDASNEPHRGGM